MLAMSEITDHLGLIIEQDPEAEFRTISFGRCEVCGEPAEAHNQIVLHPHVPEDQPRPDLGDGRVHDHVARVNERDDGWYPEDYVGWCVDCKLLATMHDEVETVPRPSES
jgi:hypothetical protein